MAEDHSSTGKSPPASADPTKPNWDAHRRHINGVFKRMKAIEKARARKERAFAIVQRVNALRAEDPKAYPIDRVTCARAARELGFRIGGSQAEKIYHKEKKIIESISSPFQWIIYWSDYLL